MRGAKELNKLTHDAIKDAALKQSVLETILKAAESQAKLGKFHLSFQSNGVEQQRVCLVRDELRQLGFVLKEKEYSAEIAAMFWNDEDIEK